MNTAEDEGLLLFTSVRQQLDEGGWKQTPLLRFILYVAIPPITVLLTQDHQYLPL